ncbi:hypothetical protein CASFOL_039897 [Castilleja foliolosa]|uniref:Uncharacterized protein n=1 Tax=Castilleja foliolosa TaxID=1961234 RepID=A0ABD3BGW0_9LAMI
MDLNQRPSPLSPHFFSSTFPALPPAISERFRHYRRSPTITSISKALHHRPHHRRSPTISAQTLAATYLCHHRPSPPPPSHPFHHRIPAPPPPKPSTAASTRRLHSRSDGTFDSPYSSQLAADYDTRLTEATASSQDPSQIDPDDIFMSVAQTKKGAFGTGVLGKTVSSSRRSCTSTVSSVPQPDPRVEELQTEVTQLRDQMQEVTDLRQQLRESDERTRRLEEMLQSLMTQGHLAPPSGPQPPQPPPSS